MHQLGRVGSGLFLSFSLGAALAPSWAQERYARPLNMKVPHISDGCVGQVRLPDRLRASAALRRHEELALGGGRRSHAPGPGADLVLLHPDGKEEVLVEGGDGSVADPMVSFDGEWVYYAKFHNLKAGLRALGRAAGPRRGHLQDSRQDAQDRAVDRPAVHAQPGRGRLVEKFGGSANGKDHIAYGVFNLGPCPLPGGKLVFVSNRNGFRPPKGGRPTLQLFVMDEDGGNVEQIGHLNISQALHPVVLVDGRIMFSSFENQGLRSSDSWGLWSIHPDGTNWGPLISAFEFAGIGANNSFHFQTQLSDESIVLESYYINNNNGFGGYLKFPPRPREGYAAFGPADYLRSAEHARAHGPALQRRADAHALPVQPDGIDVADAVHARRGGRVGAVGPRRPQVAARRQVHASLGRAGQSSADVLLARPDQLAELAQAAGRRRRHLPDQVGQAGRRAGRDAAHQERPEVQRAMAAGAGPLQAHLRRRRAASSSRRWPTTASRRRTCRRERPSAWSARRACTSARAIPSARFPKEASPRRTAAATIRIMASTRSTARRTARRTTGRIRARTRAATRNDDIHAIRILAMEPTSDRIMTAPQGQLLQPRQRAAAHPGRDSRAQVQRTAKQPLDPDGNPDTSFLAKIPADVAWTFQTLDRHGMVLNMSQTWHQLRPGEIRTNCGGCHAHSQQPTPFEEDGRRQGRLPGLGPDQEDAALVRQGSRTSPASSGTRTTQPACASRRASRMSSSIATSSRSSTAVASPATRKRPRSRRATWCSMTTSRSSRSSTT